MNRRDTLVALSLAVVVVLLLAPLARIGVDLHHDGIMLKPALDVLSGQVLFRDTFMQYGALTCYLQVVALWFQPTLLFLKLQTVVAYGVSVFFLYAAWRLILPRSLTILSCGLFILFIPGYEKNWLDQYWVLVPWSSVFAMMFQSIGLYALFRVIRGEQSQRWGFVLGLTCAGVFWCRQPVGLILIGCLVVIWLALQWTDWVPGDHPKRTIIVSIFGGFVAVQALMLGSILLSGARSEWWYQNYLWPRKWALENVHDSWGDFVVRYLHAESCGLLLVLLLLAALPSLLRKFRPAFPAGGIMIYWLCCGVVLAWQRERVFQAFEYREGGWSALFPFFVLVQAILSVTRAFSAPGKPRPMEYYLVAALAAVSLGSLLQFYPVVDPWHMTWALAPAYGLVVLIIWRSLGWRPPVLAVVLTLVFLTALWEKVQSAREVLGAPAVTLVNPAVLRGMRVPADQARSIGLIADTLGEVLRYQPDISGALIGNDAMVLCFLNNRTNPTPYFVTWDKLAENEDNQRRWNYIQRVRPLLFLQKAQWAAVGDFYRSAHYVPLLYVAEEAVEIAVPEELANVMGRTAYGGVREAVAGKAQAK